jgi:hypothetical protein
MCDLRMLTVTLGLCYSVLTTYKCRYFNMEFPDGNYLLRSISSQCHGFSGPIRLFSTTHLGLPHPVPSLYLRIK